MKQSKIQGGCLCGQVRYQVPQEPLQTVLCHCKNCQRQAGSAFSVVAVYQRNDVELEGKLRTFEDVGSSGQTVFRKFCPQCGSPILTDTPEAQAQDIIFIKAGSLDDTNALHPSVHYWASSKQNWLSLEPELSILDTQ